MSASDPSPKSLEATLDALSALPLTVYDGWAVMRALSPYSYAEISRALEAAPADKREAWKALVRAADMARRPY